MAILMSAATNSEGKILYFFFSRDIVMEESVEPMITNVMNCGLAVWISFHEIKYMCTCGNALGLGWLRA